MTVGLNILFVNSIASNTMHLTLHFSHPVVCGSIVLGWCQTFKVLLIVYKCVNDLPPKYLSDLFIPYKKDRTVRNNFKHLLDCPENRDTKSKSYGHRAFGFAGADMWNTLPLDIKLSSSVSVIKIKLKTHLFKHCYGSTN